MNGFSDDIDTEVLELLKETVQCEICGVENKKKKLVCDGCRAREGLTAARSKLKERQHKGTEKKHP